MPAERDCHVHQVGPQVEAAVQPHRGDGGARCGVRSRESLLRRVIRSRRHRTGAEAWRRWGTCHRNRVVYRAGARPGGGQHPCHDEDEPEPTEEPATVTAAVDDRDGEHDGVLSQPREDGIASGHSPSR